MDYSEKDILKFWKDKNIFKKLQDKNKGNKKWSFLDGPITANNPMGVHHAWGRTYKDVFQRYKAMRGFEQRFQNGFDCQGLWVEVEVEKELGFKTKKDIEKFGIGDFVEKCKQRVLKYSKIQTDQSIRLGQWMDWDNSYFTMSDENNYAIWHFLKKCHQKKLLYKGRDSVPWCPRCGTAISQHEILTEEYKELTHKSIFFKLPVNGQDKTYFLVWTTTPWTLPGNVALAVHPDFEYVKVKDEKGDTFIVLKEKADLVNGEIVEEVKGKKLQGLEYKGMFDEFHPNKHKVILWKEVTKEEGTGIVHIAPGCGQEDFQLAKELDLAVVDLSDDESNYRQGFGGLTGKFVGSEQVREWIFNDLEKKGLVYKIENYTHRYPTCWRCKSELIFRVVDEWYIAMNPLRKPLMKSTKKVKWIPSFGLERELDWLKNMRDWLISKKRYWGLALPIFECSCGNFEVIGSKEELKKRAVEGWKEFESHSPHRPWIDKIKLKCSKCNKLVSRIPDVGNPWLDAGIVPFSTLNYFSDKKYWKKWFPIEFICESFPGQFKNWFYSILVMSQVLVKKPPFKTLLGFASVVDEKGEEMHKSKGNAIWFDEAVEKIGADVMRWMYMRHNPFYNLRFGYNNANEVRRKLLILWNSYTFFETYRKGNKNREYSVDSVLDSFFEGYRKSKEYKGHGVDSILNKWIVSRLNGLIEKVTKSLDEFDVSKASLAIEDFFINDLSLWYIRRIRKNFQEQTLYYVLLNLCRLIAPIMPFFAEHVYQKLKTNNMPESVHLCDWPEVDKELINETLEKDMMERREIISEALAERSELKIKVRQPLKEVKLREPQSFKAIDLHATASIVSDEINVEKPIFSKEIKEPEYDTEITPELKEQGQIREMIRHIQDLRKKAGLTPKHRVNIYYSADPEFEKVLLENKQIILEQTRAKDIQKSAEGFEYTKSIKIDEIEVLLGIKKI